MARREDETRAFKSGQRPGGAQHGLADWSNTAPQQHWNRGPGDFAFPSVILSWPEYIAAGVRKWSTRSVPGDTEGEFHHALSPGAWHYRHIFVSKGRRCHEQQYGQH
jgi:hypothetical protein